MSNTIAVGRAGRLVIPKSIRDRLGLREGSRLRLVISGGKLEMVPEADPVILELKGGFPVIQGGPPPKAGDIVRALKADRDESINRSGNPEIIHP